MRRRKTRDAVSVTPRPKPLQPEDHESKCPCMDCEAWAWDLLDWEQEEKWAGRDPWRAEV